MTVHAVILTWNIVQKTELANLALEILMSVGQARVVTDPASMNYSNIDVTVPTLATTVQPVILTLTNVHLIPVTRETVLMASTISCVSASLDTAGNVVMSTSVIPRRLRKRASGNTLFRTLLPACCFLCAWWLLLHCVYFAIVTRFQFAHHKVINNQLDTSRYPKRKDW